MFDNLVGMVLKVLLNLGYLVSKVLVFDVKVLLICCVFVSRLLLGVVFFMWWVVNLVIRMLCICLLFNCFSKV